VLLFAGSSCGAADRLVLEPKGESRGHIVLVSGDEEYRSEEVMPMLGKILSQKHGFRCTVLFAFGPDGGADSSTRTTRKEFVVLSHCSRRI
jgi:hypothetical protein